MPVEIGIRSPFEFCGIIALDIDLGFKTAFSHKFIVTDNSDIGVIIGLDILTSQGLIINGAKDKLEQGSCATKLIISSLASSDNFDNFE